MDRKSMMIKSLFKFEMKLFFNKNQVKRGNNIRIMKLKMYKMKEKG